MPPRPPKTGLSSCRMLNTLGSNDGEKSFGDMGGSAHGTGDKIPGNEVVRSSVGHPSISAGSVSYPRARSPARGGAELSNVAMRAAGESAPVGEGRDASAAEESGPVSRWTRVMNSPGSTWMILGEIE